MGKSKSKNSLTKIGIAIGIVSFLIMTLYLGLLWIINVHIKQLPSSISSPIEFTKPFQKLTTENVEKWKEITILDAPTNTNGVISLLQPTTEPDLLVLYAGGLFRRWDMNTQKTLAEFDFENATRYGGNFSADGALAITPGEILLSGELNGYTIWDTHTGERLDCWGAHCPNANNTFPYVESRILIDPSGLYLIESDASLISFSGWDIAHPETSSPNFAGNNIIIDDWDMNIYSNINRITVDPSGTYFAYALEEEETSIRYFDEAAGITHDGIENSKKLGNYNEDAGIITVDLVFDYTCTWLAALRSNELVVWDLRTLFDRRQLQVPIEDGRVVAFDRTGELIAVGTGNGIQIYNLLDREKIAEYEVGEVTAIYISPDNRLLVWGDAYGNLHLWGVPINE